MLGDSITFGNSVAWDQTFSYVLQQQLNERAGRRAFEVLNLGVSGYNTAQELATLRELGLNFSPDLIVLNVCLNDSDPIKTMSAIGLRNEVGLRDSGDINFRTIVETSYLLTMLKYALGAAFEKHPAILRLLNSPEAFINVRTAEKRWDEMKQSMQEIFALARERKIPIAMVIYPYSSQIGLPEARLVPQQDLLAFAAANGIPALDASPAYVNQPQDMFADGFIHLSPYGHRVIAAAMRRLPRRAGLGSRELTLASYCAVDAVRSVPQWRDVAGAEARLPSYHSQVERMPSRSPIRASQPSPFSSDTSSSLRPVPSG